MSSDTSGDSNSMASVGEEKPKCMWKPNADQSTNIGDFQSVVNQTFGLNLGEYRSHFKKWTCNVAEIKKITLFALTVTARFVELNSKSSLIFSSVWLFNWLSGLIISIL